MALLAATAEYVPPCPSDFVPEDHQCVPVGRHRVVVEVAFDHLPQPFPLRRDVLMHAPPQCLLDRLELAPHSIASGLPLDQELAPSRLAADEGEAQEVEDLRLAEPASLAVFRREAPELDQPRLLRMQCQRILLQPVAQLVQEALGITFVLETHDEVVGISHDDHVTGGLVPSPALGPQIKDVVQVDVGKKR
jgi:hypothetical protein